MLKKFFILTSSVLFATGVAMAQKPIDIAVRVRVSIQGSPARVVLSWPYDSLAINYQIFRKEKSADMWENNGKPIFTITDPKVLSWTDNNSSTGKAYEYAVKRNKNNNNKFPNNDPYNAYGYIYAGIELPATEDRGKLVLLVDKDLRPTLNKEIDRLVNDITGDGWTVLTHYVSKQSKLDSVKNIVVADYNAGGNVKAVFLLGHIAVPYSGGDTTTSWGFPIDGHVPQHMGAWPADVYYGDVDGQWTDFLVENTRGDRPANHNISDDGKFDQNVLPSDLELQVGRVDLYNMPLFGTEVELMKRYLDKDHAFRTKAFTARRRGLVCDNFGWMSGEAFASSGYKNFAPMFADSVVTADYRTALSSGSYIWSYGTGGGTYTSAGGIGSSADFAKDSLQTVFTMLFGSFFGDWDNANNYLRAPLASKGTCLTDVWSGRPHWLFQHMALGEPIGYSAWLTENDNTNYYHSIAGRLVHVALMGDPTLRMHIMAPPVKVKATVKGSKSIGVTWSKSADAAKGYYVYRSLYGSTGGYTRITSSPVTDTFYTDNSAPGGKVAYMVRALALEVTPSGSYYNQSQGAIDTATASPASVSDIPQLSINLDIFPNPSQGRFLVQWPGAKADAGTLVITDITGKEIMRRQEGMLNGAQVLKADLSAQPAGIYLLRIQTGNQSYMGKLVKE